MISEIFFSGSTKTFGGIVLLVAALSSGSAIASQSGNKPKSVAVSPVQANKPIIRGVVVNPTSDVANPARELIEVYERISRSQKPLESEFSSFLAKNLWDLL